MYRFLATLLLLPSCLTLALPSSDGGVYKAMVGVSFLKRRSSLGTFRLLTKRVEMRPCNADVRGQKLLRLQVHEISRK